jgi:hypothetical protein
VESIHQSGVAEPPSSGLESGSVTFGNQSALKPVLAFGIAVNMDVVGVVDAAVENGISQGRLADPAVPVLDGQLTGEDRGAPVVAFFEHFQQFAALIGIQRIDQPVVENEHGVLLQLGHDLTVGAVSAGQRQLRQKFRQTDAEDGDAVTTRAVPECTGHPRLSVMKSFS